MNAAVLKLIPPSTPALDKRLDRFNAFAHVQGCEGDFKAGLDCGACRGSGEGRHEGARCSTCNGRGNVAHPLAGADLMRDAIDKAGFYDACLTDFLCDAGRTDKEINGRYLVPGQRDEALLRRDLERSAERELQALFNLNPTDAMTNVERALYRVMHMNAVATIDRYIENNL